jgi:hypothetical protein
VDARAMRTVLAPRKTARKHATNLLLQLERTGAPCNWMEDCALQHSSDSASKMASAWNSFMVGVEQMAITLRQWRSVKRNVGRNTDLWGK